MYTFSCEHCINGGTSIRTWCVLIPLIAVALRSGRRAGDRRCWGALWRVK